MRSESSTQFSKFWLLFPCFSLSLPSLFPFILSLYFNPLVIVCHANIQNACCFPSFFPLPTSALPTALPSVCCAQSPSQVQPLAAPWTVARQAPLYMGFSRQECWSGLPFPTPGDLPDPGIKPMSLASPALAGGFFTTVPLGKPLL